MTSTQEMVLEILKHAKGEFVSSRTICASLHTSRTAVWKHIQALQKQGYQVEAVTNKGYRLCDTADFVNAHEINERLTTKVLGRNIIFHEAINSTNVAARILAEQGVQEGTLVIADEQTAGRGRFSRKWYSPPKTGIWMSLIIRPNLSIAEAPRLTSLTAVAVAKTLADLSGQQVSIKWPNDILFNGKKVCGILTEVSAEGNHLQFVVVGIGMNVHVSQTPVFPATLQNKVCSLEEIMGKSIKRAEVVAKVLAAFEALYETYINENDFTKILDYLKQSSATLGKQVKIDSSTAKIAGIAEDIDEYGALLVRLPDGQLKKIFSGDIIT